MLPEIGIERVFQRELDSLPLPDEGIWLPTRRARPSSPGECAETRMPAGTEPFVRDGPSAVPSLTAPFLLDRHVFTARAAQEWVALTTVNMAPAWDLDVQVWDRQGRTALEWATFGP